MGNLAVETDRILPSTPTVAHPPVPNVASMNPDNIDIWIVIPVYNQGEIYRDVVDRALSVHQQVLMVDDGSDRPVEPSLAETRAECVRHETNRGKGAALLTGAREVARRGGTHIVTMDADGQHMPEDFPKFRRAIHEDPLSLIIGRRDMSAESVPFSSRFGRAFGNFWARMQTGQDIRDVQSGYRAYPVVLLEKIRTWCRGFAFEVEIITRAAWAGVPIRSVDVAVRYDETIRGYSHFDALRDNLRLALLNTHLSLRAFLPWPHQKLSLEGLAREKITWLHPLRSLRNLLARKASPVELGIAAALGILLGTLPLIGLHTLAIIFVASCFGLNKPLSIASSQLCMPPLVPALCVEMGFFIRHGRFLKEFSVQTLGYEAHLRLFDWAIGSLVLAPVFALVIGSIVLMMAAGIGRQLRRA